VSPTYSELRAYTDILIISAFAPPVRTLFPSSISSNLTTLNSVSQVLVTPLGALSVLIGAVLASVFLKEELGRIGRVGCALCLLGSLVIVLHAPEDKDVQNIDEILGYCTNPGEHLFLNYT